MAIVTGDVIYYRDLINAVLTDIENKCKNVPTWSSDVPNGYKNNDSWTIGKKHVDGTTIDTHNHGPGSVEIRDHYNYVNGKVTDNVAKPVSIQTVQNQLTAFLTSRGIIAKEDEIVSIKGLMNFYNNVASFYATRLVVLTNSSQNGGYLIYDGTDGLTYLNVNIGHDKDLSVQDSKTSINDLLAAINSTTNVHNLNVKISFASCSCSSSSSSSCSSSSSSSCSSSIFIAYMEI